MIKLFLNYFIDDRIFFHQLNLLERNHIKYDIILNKKNLFIIYEKIRKRFFHFENYQFF